MRVGYCDAHIEAVGDTDSPTLEAISAQLDDLRQIASASALRALRFQEEANHHFSDLRDVIPTVDTARDAIADAVGKEMLNVFPVSTVEHLVEAWLASRQGRPDDARVATVKAIEAVFKRLVRDKLTEHSSRSENTPSRSKEPPPLSDFGRNRPFDAPCLGGHPEQPRLSAGWRQC